MSPGTYDGLKATAISFTFNAGTPRTPAIFIRVGSLVITRPPRLRANSTISDSTDAPSESDPG